MENNPAYGTSESVENRQLSTEENQYELVDLPATDKTNNDKGVTGAAQCEIKKANSRKASLVIGIALSTAVLALVVAMVSVGLSTALNSKSEIQSLVGEVKRLQLSLNTIEDLGSRISALQTNTSTQYGILNQTVNTIEEHGTLISALQTNTSTQYDVLNQTVNTIEEHVSQISALQTNTATQYGILNQTVNTIEELGNLISALQTQYGILNQTVKSFQDTIRKQSVLQNKLQQQVASQTKLSSCSEIPSDIPSGEYWMLVNSSSVQVYCDLNRTNSSSVPVYCYMNRTCCNITGGWIRVAHLDMTDSNQQCPDGFLLHNETTAPLRTCGKPGPPGCVSTTFPVHGIEYSRVCGRVIGYQFGAGLAFIKYYGNRTLTVNDHYVDGVSLTHGQLPRKHIWTFTTALYEEYTYGPYTCPCTRPDITYTGVVPPFIGQDYFCDTGSRNTYRYLFYHDDPLWNGQGCGANTTCCSFNNPPWFCKPLPQPTTDDIELRMCFSDPTNTENIFLELVDIFVQ